MWMAAAVGLALVMATATASAQARPAKVLVYMGTYTDQGSKGIYRSELDLGSGRLSPPALAAATDNPSFLALHPSGRFLYAANEVETLDGKPTGSVSAFAVDPRTGDLTPLNRQASAGSGPCYVTVDQAGRHVLVANYGGGTVASLPIREDGSLLPAASSVQHKGSSIRKEQSGPRAHSINLDAASRFAVAADLGLDKLLVYRFDATGGLELHAPPHVSLPPGSGPRHFAFHPGGRYAYANNEFSSTVVAFRYDPDKGGLEEIQSLSTLPAEFKDKNSTAETQFSPDGRFVYVSNRGHDSIAVFSVDEKTGRLTARGHVVTGGKTPRHFGIDPTGAYLLAAHQNSGSVAVFKIDPKTGRPEPTGASIEVSRPVCVKFLARPRE
jgi:6-phosphogluconolactonase